MIGCRMSDVVIFCGYQPKIKTKKTIFQSCPFQLNLKKSTLLPAPAAAHIVRKLDEKPKDWPKNSNINIVAEIINPENHQDQGCVSNSIIFVIY